MRSPAAAAATAVATAAVDDDDDGDDATAFAAAGGGRVAKPAEEPSRAPPSVCGGVFSTSRPLRGPSRRDS